MIEDKEAAKSISDLMLEFGARLDASLIAMQSKLPEKEFHWYRDAVSRIMGPMLLEVMNPIYRLHPSIKPPELN